VHIFAEFLTAHPRPEKSAGRNPTGCRNAAGTEAVPKCQILEQQLLKNALAQSVGREAATKLPGVRGGSTITDFGTTSCISKEAVL
jgi:hypothetical protein